MKVSSIPILLICVLQAACVIDPGGDRTTRTSEPGEFDAIAIEGGFENVDVEVCGDCSPRVKITGDERQVDEIIVSVDDGVLTLRHRSRLVLTDIDLEAVIRVPSLGWLNQSGSSDVHVTGVAIESFEIISSGSGDVFVEGIVGDFEAVTSGSGEIAAYELQAQVVDLTVSGSGDVKVCAKQSLRARSTGSGDVFYDCNPDTTDFDGTGSGRLSIR